MYPKPLEGYENGKAPDFTDQFNAKGALEALRSDNSMQEVVMKLPQVEVPMRQGTLRNVALLRPRVQYSCDNRPDWSGCRGHEPGGFISECMFSFSYVG